MWRPRPEAVRVPMLHFDPTELVRFGGLALIARRVVEGLLAGTHPSPFRGFTPEVADHRPYNPGDDARRIDWRASEKSNRLLVKRSVEESKKINHKSLKENKIEKTAI